MSDKLIKRALKAMETDFAYSKIKLNSSGKVKDYCRLHIGASIDEVFGVIFLNSQFEFIAFEKFFTGTINECHIYARPILRKAFELNASKMIFTHNHPSDNNNPSVGDITMTRELNKIFKKLECPIVDHIIVTPTGATSMAESHTF